MSSVIFTADNSVQGTITTITSTSIGSGYIYAYTTHLSNLSTYTKLNVDNLNATSTTILGNLNSLSGLSFFLTNYTNLNTLNVSGNTTLNNSTTINS